MLTNNITKSNILAEVYKRRGKIKNAPQVCCPKGKPERLIIIELDNLRVECFI